MIFVHMMMIMDRDYDLCRLIHNDCCWLIMMIIMIDDLLMTIHHDWWLMIMIISEDLSWSIMTAHGWRLTDWLIDWSITNTIMITTVRGLYRPTELLFLICFWYHSVSKSTCSHTSFRMYMYTCMFACMFFFLIQTSVCICTHAYIYMALLF